MRIASTIFFLILMVSIQTPAGQLLKLPLLIEHYIKHQKQNGVSIVAFLAEHYSSNHNDDDKPEDEQLPFKNVTFNAIGYAIVPGVIKANAMAPLPYDKKVIFPETYAPQQHLARIFHPPRA